MRQSRIREEQDFLPPPDGYLLWGLNVATHLGIKKSTLHLRLRIENLLNRKYRDYLNRLRYFSDETGTNINLVVNYSF